MKLGKRLNRRKQGNSKLSVGDAYEILERRNLLATYTVDFSQLAPSDYSSSEILVRFQDDVSVDELQKTSYVEMMNHNAILCRWKHNVTFYRKNHNATICKRNHNVIFT